MHSLTNVPFISLNTAIAITGLSKRTLRRRAAEGVLRTDEGTSRGERARVALEDVVPLARLHLKTEDLELIADADAGSAEAQCDLGLLLLEEGLREDAVPWFSAAASQNHLEGMHWLGRCYIAGIGVPADENRGIDWIARAASYGHVTAKRMVQYLYDPSRPQLTSAALEAELDAIEQEVVLSVLEGRPL